MCQLYTIAIIVFNGVSCDHTTKKFMCHSCISLFTLYSMVCPVTTLLSSLRAFAIHSSVKAIAVISHTGGPVGMVRLSSALGTTDLWFWKV